MKKSSIVLLTIVAALTISSCAVQKSTENLGPPDPMYAEQVSDTTRSYLSDTKRMQTPQYNYYYRSNFWDNLYRIFLPRKYNMAISKPGYVPRHTRPPKSSGSRHHRSRSESPSSNRRGGFGHHGSTTTPVS
jgi:hypothetical protein